MSKNSSLSTFKELGYFTVYQDIQVWFTLLGIVFKLNWYYFILDLEFGFIWNPLHFMVGNFLWSFRGIDNLLLHVMLVYTFYSFSILECMCNAILNFQFFRSKKFYEIFKIPF